MRLIRRTRLASFLLGALIGASLAAAAAIRPTSAADIAGPHLALVIKTFRNPYFKTMVEGAKDGAADFGASLEVAAPDFETSVDQQIDIIDRLVSQKVDGIVVAPADSVRVIPALKRAEAASIPIVNIDNPIDRQAAIAAGLTPPPLVTVDNSDGAYRAVKSVLASFPLAQAPIKAAIIEGIPGAENGEARKAGALKAFAEQPRVQIVASESGNWERDEGERVAAAIIARTPDLDLLFCANDNMALGALAALAALGAAGAHAKIIGYDALPEALEAVRNGALAATVDQRAARQGHIAVEYLMKRLNGESVPPESFVDVRIVSE
ncbi:LacI family transcriptional regulator [Aliidongia dinghuensis]|uniref:LacI family transcriptional regulator n=1 Tax=Aliidongia dinghuensis TaxID=1867774 RepID=A0A8J3E663_9PROT|nr:substrate-binding domain-containing protein [Aliidongia dinghuensis]GGF41570.1 LacI family transcriptional regulator [Aliidongia dinghuensis]